MKKIIVATIVFAASIPGASASVVGTLGNAGLPLVTLGQTGLAGGSIASLSGGTVYSNNQPFAAEPAGTNGGFLAAGPSSGTIATLTFTEPVDYLSFLWGSPDTYNMLSITSTTGTYNFTVASLGFPVANGDRSFASYVQFSTDPGESLLSATFTNAPERDAFEVSNFSVGLTSTSIAPAVPEPSTWAMLLIGFAALGWIGSRQRQQSPND